MPGWEKLLYCLSALAGYGVLCLICFRQFRRQFPVLNNDTGVVIVAYASQSGNALRVAELTREALGSEASLLPLNRVNEDVLSSAEKAYFIVSTYGEGEAPDNGARFERLLLRENADKRGPPLQYAMLALGDSRYADFCGFGRRVNQSLQDRGAQPMFPLVEVDAASDPDCQNLTHWWRGLGVAVAEQSDVTSGAGFELWTLRERKILNPGSQSAPLVGLRFGASSGSTLHWQAGDIVEVLPRNCEHRCQQLLRALDARLADDQVLLTLLQDRQLPHSLTSYSGDREALHQYLQSLPQLVMREYSIASLPSEGCVELIIRQRRDDHGNLGLASQWLTETLQVGQTQPLRVRSNPLFHSPQKDVPLIAIGSGSGMAGLWGHIKLRQLQGARQNWLVFGERCPETDRIYSQELKTLSETGYLSKLDLAFSRCQHDPLYVQDRLLEAAPELISWVENRATLMVCGSRSGMAAGVDQTLRDILGHAVVDALVDAGRYRRDVY